MQLSPGGVYDAPVVFAELPHPEVVHAERVWMLLATFETDKDALRRLLPSPLEPADEPLVHLIFQKHGDIDYLGGGSYNSLTVGLAAVHDGGATTLEGTYAAIVWESLVAPILFGSDLVGAPKLCVEVPDACQVRAEWRAHAAENGHVLAALRVSDPQPLEPAIRKLIERRTNARPWLTTRPMADPFGRQPPTEVVLRTSFVSHFEQGAFGEPRVRFGNIDWDRAPSSSLAVRELRSLVVKDYRGGFVLEGTAAQELRGELD